jgi:hypothetical protein
VERFASWENDWVSLSLGVLSPQIARNRMPATGAVEPW